MRQRGLPPPSPARIGKPRRVISLGRARLRSSRNSNSLEKSRLDGVRPTNKYLTRPLFPYSSGLSASLSLPLTPYSLSLLRRVRMLMPRSLGGLGAVLAGLFQRGQDVMLLHLGQGNHRRRPGRRPAEGGAAARGGRRRARAALAPPEAEKPRCSGSNWPASPQRMTARSMTFCNSRTLPGQEWASRAARVGRPCHARARRVCGRSGA